MYYYTYRVWHQGKLCTIIHLGPWLFNGNILTRALCSIVGFVDEWAETYAFVFLIAAIVGTATRR